MVFWVSERDSVVAWPSSIDPVVDNRARISSVVATSLALPAVVTN